MDPIIVTQVSCVISACCIGALITQETCEILKSVDFYSGVPYLVYAAERYCRWALAVLLVASVAIYAMYPSSSSLAGVQCSGMLVVYCFMWLWDFPLLGIIPWHLIACSICFLVPYGGELFIWRAMGDYTTVSFYFVTIVLSCLSAAALCLWSRLFNAVPGPFQFHMGPRMTSHTAVLAFAFGNALVEELEFRGILAGALARDSFDGRTGLVTCASSNHILAVIWVNVLFALEHYKMGFPSGPVGAGLVFAWGCALSILRCASGGLWHAYLVHVAADLTIGYLLWRKEMALNDDDRLRRALWLQGWEVSLDEDTDRFFFYHIPTGKSQWECPPSVEEMIYKKRKKKRKRKRKKN